MVMCVVYDYVVPGGLTFASCAGEDVAWSELFNSGGRELLTSSAHALTTHVSSTCVHMHTYVCDNRCLCT
jgi:hypothetical protein